MKNIKKYEDFFVDQTNEEINIKKALAGAALGAGLAFSNPSKGQITTTKVAPIEQQVKTSAYDSLSNFLGEDIKKLVGQKIYACPKSETLRKYGYDGFIKDYKISDPLKLSNTYNPILPEGDKASSYIKYDIGGGRSLHDSIAGKYFKVLDVIKNEKGIGKFKDYFLKLQEEKSGDILYFVYSSEFKHSFPFIVAGYYEKLKQNYVGKKFIISKSYDNTELVDIETKKSVIPSGQWTCLDITIEDKYYTLSLLLKNNLGQKVTVSLNELRRNIDNPEYSSPSVMEFTEYNKLCKKFGKEFVDIIMSNKVKIGMTKDMCKMSWGEPKDINKTTRSGSSTEQWVYDNGSYLYFDSSGKLTSIKN